MAVRAVTMAELLANSPAPKQLERVLRDEVERGRVRHDPDGYRIAPNAFPAEVLEGLVATATSLDAAKNHKTILGFRLAP